MQEIGIQGETATLKYKQNAGTKIKWARILTALACLSCVIYGTFADAEEQQESKQQVRKRIEKGLRKKPKSGFPQISSKSKDEDPRWRYYGSVSFIKLVARPEMFHKKFVATEGYLRLSRNAFLFSDEVQSNALLFQNAMFLSPGPEISTETLSRFDKQYVYLEGNFNQWERDPNYCPNGTITVSRIYKTEGHNNQENQSQK